MAVNGKRKGKNGELELARKLKEHGYDVRRSVQYNGRTEEGEADLLGLPGIHIECKRTERLSLYEAVDQAKRDSNGKNQIPVVFHRKNNCEWVAILPLDNFMDIYREWEAGFDLSGDSSLRSEWQHFGAEEIAYAGSNTESEDT